MSSAIVSDKDKELEEMIRHLQTRMVYLEGRVAQLESGRNPANPNPYQQPSYYPPISDGIKCVKCGMVIKGVSNYYCANMHCPIQPKAISATGYYSTSGG